jgi:hypothetical protein
MTDFRKISVLVGLVLSLSGGGEVGAKTASWSVEPKYSNIEMLSPGTYLVKRGVYSSIIDGEGRAIVPNTTDSITPFVENQALILTPAEDGRYRLQGILHDDFTTTAVAEEAYVDDYPFFSEGLLPVCNKSGFYGYMDPTGRLVLPMRYLNPRPFSEGYAAVIQKPKGGLLQGITKVLDKARDMFKQKATTIYINRAGTELKTAKEIGKIYNATTFNNGTAYVENNKGEFFTINLQGQIVKRGQIANYDVDDHYALVSDDDQDDVEIAEKKQPQNGGVVTFTRNNLTGYRTTAGTIVLPAQFTDAEEFADGYALAEVNGKWGILKLEDGTFSGHAVVAARSKKGRKGKGTPAAADKFTVTTPQSYANEPLTLTMDNEGTKNSESLEGTGSESRTYAMAAPTTGNTVVTLSTPNLILWETHMVGSKQTDLADNNSQSGSANKNGRLRISISPKSAKADIKDNAAVTVTLTNPTDVAVSTTVRVSGNGLMGVNKAISIPAHGSRRVSTVFTKVFQKELRTVTVSAGGRTTSKGIVVNPFYVKF